MTVNYQCKFCQRPGAIEIEETPGINFQISKWKSFLACNRCADYMTSKRTVEDKIKRISINLIQARQLNSKKLPEFEGKVREKLVYLTKDYTAIVCKYFDKLNEWDIELVNMLMEKPYKFTQILSMYRNGIKKA